MMERGGGGGGRAVAPQEEGRAPRSQSEHIPGECVLEHPAPKFVKGDNADPSLEPTYLPWERGGESWAVGVREA